jgi:prolyl-tRNA synthetase
VPNYHYEQEPTTRSEDYSKWYNELVVKADLAENSGVRGMVIKPYGYAIWEKCKQSSIECLETGHQNAYSIICSKEHV